MRMKIENIRVEGFEPAFHAMRNPWESWPRSDSVFFQMPDSADSTPWACECIAVEDPLIGENDMELAKKLIMRGSEHRKFMRQIMIWFNITIPRYVWQELDTYKVATVRNSCSTMNKLGSTDLEQEDFQLDIQEMTLEHINKLGALLRDAKDEREGVREARQQLKNDLPEGFLQKATCMMSYETALAVILQRENHRLPEWRKHSLGSIVDTLLGLPYMMDLYEAATFKRRMLKNAISSLRRIIESAGSEELVEVHIAFLEKIYDQINKAR